MTKEMTITDEMWEAVQVRLASGVVAKVAPTMVARVNHRMCAMCGKAITTILKYPGCVSTLLAKPLTCFLVKFELVKFFHIKIS